MSSFSKYKSVEILFITQIKLSKAGKDIKIYLRRCNYALASSNAFLVQNLEESYCWGHWRIQGRRGALGGAPPPLDALNFVKKVEKWKKNFKHLRAATPPPHPEHNPEYVSGWGKKYMERSGIFWHPFLQ